MMTAIKSLLQQKQRDWSTFCSTASDTLVTWSIPEEGAITARVNRRVHIVDFCNAHINQYVFCFDSPVMLRDPMGWLPPDCDLLKPGDAQLRRNFDQITGKTKTGMFTVAIHGDKDSVWMVKDGKFQPITIAELIEEMKKKGYGKDFKGQAVKLYSCDTGATPNSGPAQELADALGVPVLAPKKTWYPVGGANGSQRTPGYGDPRLPQFTEAEWQPYKPAVPWYKMGTQ